MFRNRSSRHRLLAALLLVPFTACYAVAGGAAPGPDTRPPAEICKAELDAALARLEREEETIRTLFDTDAAAVDAAEYTLQKAERSLLETLAAERDAARARYRRCRAAAGRAK